VKKRLINLWNDKMEKRGRKTAHWAIPKKSERANNDTPGSWVLWINTINPRHRLKK
jgi:hypothetical protein